MNAGADDAVMLWTVRGSLALMAAGFSLRHLRRPRAFRLCSAGGAVLMPIHIAAAFGARHGWSHAAAVADTARQTRALTGLDWGGGVWVNYLFAALWLADAAWAALAPAAYDRRPRRLEYTVGASLGFIAFNGAVVFAAGPTRWVGLAACGGIAATWFLARRRDRGGRRADRAG